MPREGGENKGRRLSIVIVEPQEDTTPHAAALLFFYSVTFQLEIDVPAV